MGSIAYREYSVPMSGTSMLPTGTDRSSTFRPYELLWRSAPTWRNLQTSGLLLERGWREAPRGRGVRRPPRLVITPSRRASSPRRAGVGPRSTPGRGQAVYLPVTTRQLADGTVEIAPSGEIDLDNAHVMRDAVNDVLTTSTPGKICLALQRVMLIDSIGIGILVACFHTAAASGVKLVVSHPSPTVYRQLWVSGLVGLLGCAEPPSPRTSVGLRPS